MFESGKNLIWITHGLPLFTDFMPLVRRLGAASVRAGIQVLTLRLPAFNGFLSENVLVHVPCNVC
jgi:hypothetical protein